MKNHPQPGEVAPTSDLPYATCRDEVVHSQPEAPNGRRFREETGEVVVAGSGSCWRYLHRRSRPPDSRLSNRPKVPVQSSRAIRVRGSTPYGVMDLLRRGRLLGPALSRPGLAAFDSGDPERCGRSEGLATRADDIGHLYPKIRTAASLTGLTEPAISDAVAYLGCAVPKRNQRVALMSAIQPRSVSCTASSSGSYITFTTLYSRPSSSCRTCLSGSYWRT